MSRGVKTRGSRRFWERRGGREPLETWWQVACPESQRVRKVARGEEDKGTEEAVKTIKPCILYEPGTTTGQVLCHRDGSSLPSSVTCLLTQDTNHGRGGD